MLSLQRPSESTVVQIHQSDSGSTQPADVGRQRGQRKRKMTDRQLALQKNGNGSVRLLSKISKCVTIFTLEMCEKHKLETRVSESHNK